MQIGGGIPLRGVCLYPILGMPEWHDQKRWTQMGLWELSECNETQTLKRKVCEPMLEALKKAQRIELNLAEGRYGCTQANNWRRQFSPKD